MYSTGLVYYALVYYTVVYNIKHPVTVKCADRVTWHLRTGKLQVGTML